MTTDYDSRVGELVREARGKREVTLHRLATVLSEAELGHLDAPALSRIETGKRPLRLREASYIAAALGVPLDALVPDASVPPRIPEPVDEFVEKIRAVVRAELISLSLIDAIEVAA